MQFLRYSKFFSVLTPLTLFFLLQYSEHVRSERIVALLFFCSKSMKNAFDPLLNDLASRGHQITVVSPHKPSSAHPNIRNIVGPDNKAALDTFENFYEARSRGVIIHPMLLFPFTEIVCRSHYDLPEVKALRNETFDLVMTNGLLNECVFGLIHHFNTTFMGLSTIAAPHWVAKAIGKARKQKRTLPNSFKLYIFVCCRGSGTAFICSILPGPLHRLDVISGARLEFCPTF